MVVFTCSACGESVKKGQVEKHVNICRNCQCLSCMDCGKDFWGDDYKSHVKCISEDQKYGGKGYEAKTNKGDVKQQEWIQKIHEVLKKPNISPKVRNILEQMHTYDNIPRKKVKFQNWMVNSLNVDNSALQDQVWEIFSEATSNGPSKKELEKPLQKVGSQPVKSEVNPLSAEKNEMTADKLEKKKSKRERKEERQKNKKTEKKEVKVESQRENSENKKGKKPKKEKEGTENENEETSKSSNAERKKKKHERNNTAQLEINGNGNHNEEKQTNIKKHKRKHPEEEPYTTTKRMKYIKTSATTETEEIGDADKGKFNWKGTIKAVLKQAPNNEISIKKLRKKVLAQYHAVVGEHHKSQEDLLVIFNKKVNNNPKVKVLKEKVKLMK
ncbi:cell growth-regulating nucleolar protein isoform X1 [Chelonia mydas]|uniref:cell growth-regulating nucleolar protein isoform X1 n=1 Tax=Chelonia mydas TaxID=8469 RepID=UPI0018A1E2FF|nr:cell growth-regulating nucleolar protein isoform X1 [Chelonia mydas]XP_037753996.1 cell growth-regulating nucleolar protein isoform X1 [Chelonia mydas]XP_037753997.1 cell growth-regulating nucleolar protein isoform X1 [Chelonia mydas]XP_043400588.1 cell growth-regulating nucleolar protein isoform X1 [Chelonia mydas]XP_043400589.1 cell growth-regulating nucleolar protein isoform X1 [Chelonia mydas]